MSRLTSDQTPLGRVDVGCVGWQLDDGEPVFVRGDEVAQRAGQLEADVVPDQHLGPSSWMRARTVRSRKSCQPKPFGWSFRPVYSRTA